MRWRSLLFPQRLFGVGEFFVAAVVPVLSDAESVPIHVRPAVASITSGDLAKSAHRRMALNSSRFAPSRRGSITSSHPRLDPSFGRDISAYPLFSAQCIRNESIVTDEMAIHAAISLRDLKGSTPPRTPVRLGARVWRTTWLDRSLLRGAAGAWIAKTRLKPRCTRRYHFALVPCLGPP